MEFLQFTVGESVSSGIVITYSARNVSVQTIPKLTDFFPGPKSLSKNLQGGTLS